MMQIEWDAAKAEANLRKHDVSFAEAAHVFKDFGRIERYDNRDDYNEERWITIGMSWTTLLSVVYTVRNEDTIRIISARKANANEQTQYNTAHGSS